MNGASDGGRARGSRKDEIVRAARELIEAKGVEAVTMRGLGTIVGISGPGLYRHFADRRALLGAVARSAGHELGAYLGAALAEPTPTRRLAATGERYLDFALEQPALYALLFESADALPPPEGELSPPLAFLFDRVGECQPGAPAPAQIETALELWALVHGVASLYLHAGGAAMFPRDDYRAMARRMIARAAESVSTRYHASGELREEAAHDPRK